MKNKEITSIELLFKEMLSNQQCGITLSFDENVELFKTYQQLHKAEIIQAYEDGVSDECIYATFSARDFDKTGEQYYTENYEL
jgi:hypothetical protein